MSQETSYLYYKVDSVKAECLKEDYLSIGLKREEILTAMLDDFSCVAWTTTSGWGLPAQLDEMVYESAEDFEPKHYSVRQDFYKGEKVYCVRGKRSSKQGRQFNKTIAEYNSRLTNYPNEPDFIIDSLKARATGLGKPEHPTKGIPMLSTYGGRVGDEIVLAIPKNPERNFTLPEGLTEITYGQFYDLINSGR